MTEEQNKLAEEIDVLIGRLRMHAGASDTHIPRPLLATAADALAALCEREPATEAVLEPIHIDRYYFGGADQSTLILVDTMDSKIYTIDELNAALKGKGASQGETIAAPQELRAGEGSSGTRSAGMSDQSPAVAAPEPSGEFVRVPREPTDAMLKAAWHQQNPNMPEAALGYSTGASADYNRATYRAMLAASLDEQKG